MKKEIKSFIITLLSLGSAIIIFALVLILKNGAGYNSTLDVSPAGVKVDNNNTFTPIHIPETIAVTITEPATEETTTSAAVTSYLIEDFNILYQNPELPTGCEVTALTMLLNYIGYDIDKVTLADNYLRLGTTADSTVSDAFVGNPHSYQSYGCFIPVIIDCAVDYLKTQDVHEKIYNYTGSSFRSILKNVANGHPCMVWGTNSMLEPYPTDKWVVNGVVCQWLSDEHCMIVLGFDYEKNEVTVADPLYGIKNFNLDLFEKRFDQMGKQALFIY